MRVDTLECEGQRPVVFFWGSRCGRVGLWGGRNNLFLFPRGRRDKKPVLKFECRVTDRATFHGGNEIEYIAAAPTVHEMPHRNPSDKPTHSSQC